MKYFFLLKRKILTAYVHLNEFHFIKLTFNIKQKKKTAADYRYIRFFIKIQKKLKFSVLFYKNETPPKLSILQQRWNLDFFDR